MAVLLGVYKIVNSIGFNENWNILSHGYIYGDINIIIVDSQNETDKNGKIQFFSEYNYIE